MKNYITIIVLLLLLVHPFTALAQGENNIWCFGYRTGLDFNNGNPTLFEHNMEVYEGCASVSDPSGNLLFYTSGSKVWDRNGNPMPNGSGLAGNTFSSMKGVAIVPSVSNPDQYFVLTTDEIESGLSNAYYSVVDMSLNGGLGDVIPSQSSILIATGVTEGIATTMMPDCSGYWFILHRKNSADYLAYRIDASGVSTTPVVSSGLIDQSWYFCFNNTGDRIALLESSNLETASFDNTTGILSGFAEINLSPAYFLYCIFSPDDQKLFFTGVWSGVGAALFQIDLSLLPDTIAVQNSCTLVVATHAREFRQGPDQKLYGVGYFPPPGNLIRVNNPNASGPACDPETAFLPWPPFASTATPPFNSPSFHELGNPVVQYRRDTLASGSVTVVCEAEELMLVAPQGYRTYRWNTGGTSSSETVTQSGTYWVSGIKDCFVHIDSFHVTFNSLSLALGPDTFICDGQTKILNATNPGAAYLWQDGSTLATYAVSQTGTYQVTVSKDGCIAKDTVYIEVVAPQLSIPEPDTTLCSGAQLVLHAIAKPSSQFLWNTGSTADHIVIGKGGTYMVTATSACGTLSDEVVIGEIVCNCTAPFVPNAFTPNGDGKNDVLLVRLNCPGATDFHFSIYNRYGQRVFESTNPDAGWNGFQRDQKTDIGTYFYQLTYKTAEGIDVKKKGDVILLR